MSSSVDGDLGDQYQCQLCSQTFPKDRTHIEALAEYQAAFPKEYAAGQPMAYACDPCYQQLMEGRPHGE